MEHGKIVPEAKISWVIEQRFQGAHYTARFRHEPGQFTVIGLSPDRVMIAPGLGITGFCLDDRLSFGVRYDAEIGGHFWDQLLNFETGFRF